MAVFSENLCGNCQQRPSHIDRTLVAWRYADPMIQLIHQLKFSQQLLIAPTLGKLLIDFLSSAYQAEALPDKIIPVPLHRARLATRGFNQALEIAKPISKRFLVPIDNQLINRIKPTLPQSELPAKYRRKNVRGAFLCTKILKGQSILIIDDVITTGATVDELARCIKAAGAKRVTVLACARTAY